MNILTTILYHKISKRKGQCFLSVLKIVVYSFIIKYNNFFLSFFIILVIFAILYQKSEKNKITHVLNMLKY
jgi:hypothetical protein